MAFLKNTALELLQRSHAAGRLGHAYLISGGEGSHTRDFALDLASMVTHGTRDKILEEPDVHYAEPESKSRRIVIEQVRELEHSLQLKAMGKGRKVAIIFDADRLQPQASNAFLKTLEEPPSNSLLLLVTAYPEMLLDTIRSRCIRVTLRGDGAPKLDEEERAAVNFLAGFFERGSTDLAAIFGLCRDFLDLFGTIKARITEHCDDEFKRERDHYAKTTDGSWLEERETHYKALIEAQYQLGRFRLVEIIDRWFGDLLRQRCAPGTALDFAEHESLIIRLAEEMDLPRLLSVSEPIAQLRENLGRTVQEALAVEVAFLRIFGTPNS